MSRSVDPVDAVTRAASGVARETLSRSEAVALAVAGGVMPDSTCVSPAALGRLRARGLVHDGDGSLTMVGQLIANVARMRVDAQAGAQ
jgi:hypothetical protein